MVNIGHANYGTLDKAPLGEMCYCKKTFGHYDKGTMCILVLWYSGRGTHIPFFSCRYLALCENYSVCHKQKLSGWGTEIRHSLRLNVEVVARAWQNFGSLVVGVNIILQVVILSFYVPCKKLTKKMEKCPKSVQFLHCITYCTERLTLGHVQLFDKFLEVKLQHLEVR